MKYGILFSDFNFIEDIIKIYYALYLGLGLLISVYGLFRVCERVCGYINGISG